MGNYNPYQPQILGQEWVPIREEDTVFSPAVNVVELGHGFTLTTSEQVSDARFYVNTLPPGRALGQVYLATVYAQGEEDATGPIERLVIPCNAALVSGGAVATGTAVADLADPSDNKSVFFPATGAPSVSCHFPVLSYAAPLLGKRILAVNILYVMAVDNTASPPPTVPVPTNRGVFSIQSPGVGVSVGFGVPDLAAGLVGSTEINRCRLGEIDHFWSVAFSSPSGTSERLPWRWQGLADFDIATSFIPRINFQYTHDPTTTAYLTYIAMEVIYCEENRTLVGGNSFGESGFVTAHTPYIPGANIIQMRTLAQAADPILAAGDWTIAISSADLGDAGGPAGLEDRAIALSQYPNLNALRELYGLPTHPGVQVNVPFPAEEHLGDTFTQVTTHVLPQLSLHASGATLTEPHVYGRQGAAQVYGANTATQEIYDDVVGGTASYPQVRYVARRFADTTQPLVLTGTGSLAASTTSITVAEFDALTEIIDGWKEVTLRFAVPPTMGALATPEPSWTWSSTTETAGNRWEILAACAPAISGTPGNLFNLVPAADQLYAATYQPPAGAQAELTWMPQGVGSPYVTGATEDVSCDAFLIFSQDPPTVTGVGLTAQTQAVTGLGFNCGSLPCCIPSGISYQTVTWSPLTIGVSGFGAYELQRFDTTPGADFETIMLASSPYVTGFNDFEARVGVDSVYRIRSLNVYNFAGAWSTQVTGGIPSPGVTGGCDDATGALIFTSNADQSGGSNAAYMMQWESTPIEDFGLPEADMVVFQAMYGRDGVVAFHGTERGLEEFSRVLLIHAAAIDPVRLADVKTLRDLAWADLPYICVRDDIADRWFANVQVPTVNARFNRTTYMARVDIRELTRTPYAVDP